MFTGRGARTGVHQGADLFFGGEGQRAGDLRQFFRFHFVQLVIAAHQQGNQRGSAIFNRFHQQSFHGFFDRQVELLHQLSDGFGVRRIDGGHLWVAAARGSFGATASANSMFAA